MNRNVILKAIVDILDEFDSSCVNENDKRFGDLVYELECFIESELGENYE